MRAWARFGRRLKARWPELAWLRAIERHKSGALHVHAVLSHRVSHRELAELWGHGFVWISPPRRGRGVGRREQARSVARYVAKYVAKDLETAPPGSHGYEVAQGFRPEPRRLAAWDRESAWRMAVALMGGEVPHVQSESETWLDYRGPPALFLGW